MDKFDESDILACGLYTCWRNRVKLYQEFLLLSFPQQLW